MRRSLLALALALALLLGAGGVMAQLVAPNPDWQESETPAPPAFSVDRLVPVEMPRHLSVKVGVDPQTLRITEDGIVRYVMVAISPNGNINATYEGIRCLTAQVKTYARFGTARQWAPVADPQWQPLNGNQPSMHALALARQGACDGRAAAASSPAAIIAKLRDRPADRDQR